MRQYQVEQGIIRILQKMKEMGTTPLYRLSEDGKVTRKSVMYKAKVHWYRRMKQS